MLPPAVLARARDVLQRLERYELDVFADQIEPLAQANEAASASTTQAQRSADVGALAQAARRARRQALAAQATLFDVVNKSLLDELRAVEVEKLSLEEVRALLLDIRKRII